MMLQMPRESSQSPQRHPLKPSKYLSKHTPRRCTVNLGLALLLSSVSTFCLLLINHGQFVYSIRRAFPLPDSSFSHVRASSIISAHSLEKKRQTFHQLKQSSLSDDLTDLTKEQQVHNNADDRKQKPKANEDSVNLNGVTSTRNTDDVLEEKPHVPWVGGTQPLPRNNSRQCLQYILYDRPPRTSGDLYMVAMKKYLRTFEVIGGNCKHPYCRQRVRDTCKNHRPIAHIYGALPGQQGLVECMRDRGYYIVTSIRPPRERWDMQYLYGVLKWTTGTPVNTSPAAYASFMAHYPDCQLLNYYDGEGVDCDSDKIVDDRIARIVKRYDEVIVHDNEPVGILEQRLQKYLESPKLEVPSINMEGFSPDVSRLRSETKLYLALKRLRRNPQYPNRVLC